MCLLHQLDDKVQLGHWVWSRLGLNTKENPLNISLLSFYVDLWHNVHMDYYLYFDIMTFSQTTSNIRNIFVITVRKHWSETVWTGTFCPEFCLSTADAACRFKYVWSASPLYYLHKTANQLGNYGSDSVWTQGHFSATWVNI